VPGGVLAGYFYDRLRMAYIIALIGMAPAYPFFKIAPLPVILKMASTGCSHLAGRFLRNRPGAETRMLFSETAC
jgi:hypothetical protein